MMNRNLLTNLEGRSKDGYTTWGCIWEKGKYSKETAFTAYDEDGKRIPIQSRITAFWPDGSIKWTAHTANSTEMTRKIEVLAVQKEEEDCRNHNEKPIAIQTNDGWQIDTGRLQMQIKKGGAAFFEKVLIDGKVVIESVESVLVIEERPQSDTCVKKQFISSVKQVELVENGPVCAVVKYQGIHEAENGKARFPFTIFMRVGKHSERLDFTHTFLFDGDENKEFLKGLGIKMKVPMKGPVWNRHVKFQGDYGFFHEAAVQLLGGKVIPWNIYDKQTRGEMLGESLEGMEKVRAVANDLPHWDRYEFYQDSVNHFAVKKRTASEQCCYLNCLDGARTKGGAALGSENGNLMLCGRDFWERYPSGYSIHGLAKDMAEVTMWQWDPHAEAMDFRHYAESGYDQIYYEGYSWKGAAPYGIACTSEWSVQYDEAMIPDDSRLSAFAESVRKPPQYVCSPECYHKHKVFGRWSLPSVDTEVEQWLEKQLTAAVNFYSEEVEQRNWYGMFDYGDIMHSYDKYRHMWRYDMGGFAWDNTELVPTFWLWYMFLRTGREDIFSMAERMCRHTSEVDVYHMGAYKGLGSRHNVRHWGCPCKEVRIAMAGHHRFYYFLTGDYRLGEIFEEFKDAEYALLEKDPLEAFYPSRKEKFPTHARSGPDWSSLCANWLVRWERFHDTQYLEKILTGITDIKHTPFRLISGPDYGFNPEGNHLYYMGERGTGGVHLQVCMGASQLWIELADLLEQTEWKEMVAELGEFYFLDREEQQRRTDNQLGERTYTLKLLAAALGAYSAWYSGNIQLAQTVWKKVFSTMTLKGKQDGFDAVLCHHTGNKEWLSEIDWVHTNFVSQWCLNTIVCLDLIKDALPETWEQVEAWLKESPDTEYRKV